MLAKIKILLYNLKTPQGMGLLFFMTIALLISWSGVKAMQTNYELQKRIASLEFQNKNQELENANLKLKNEYLKTDQYLELTARRVFGKAAHGEKVVIVPKEVAQKHTIELAGASDKIGSDERRPNWQKNLELWRNFFFK